MRWGAYIVLEPRAARGECLWDTLWRGAECIWREYSVCVWLLRIIFALGKCKFTARLMAELAVLVFA